MDPRRRLQHVVGAPGGHHHAELVAAEARDRVGVAKGAAEANRQLPEQLVAARMPERVVDLLETVEVEQQDRCAAAGASRVREGGLDPVVEEHAVRQAREAVVERLVLDLLHVRVDLAGRPTEDGEQRDEEHQQHPLEHERNRHERGRDGACDGCVVTLGHEHACGAVPEPDRHELAQHRAGGSVAGGRLLDRCPDLLTCQRGANRRRGVERRRAGAGRLRGGEPEAPTGVVQRRRLDVVDHDLLPEEPLQGASPGGRQLPLEVTGRELPGEHGLRRRTGCSARRRRAPGT